MLFEYCNSKVFKVFKKYIAKLILKEKYSITIIETIAQEIFIAHKHLIKLLTYLTFLCNEEGRKKI